jgi:hypothetical protein
MIAELPLSSRRDSSDSKTNFPIAKSSDMCLHPSEQYIDASRQLRFQF